MDEPTFAQILGRKIRALRKIRRMSQPDVAEALGYNSSGTISLIEAGKSGMSQEKIFDAAKLFGVHPMVLMSEKELSESDLEMYVSLQRLLDRESPSKHYETIRALLRLSEVE